MSFQKKLNRDLPLAVEGDFASTNPYHTLLAGEASLKAGTDGVIVGRFAWVDTSTGLATNVKGANTLIGFVWRDKTALITDYLGEATLKIAKGFGVTLYDGGDFWGRFAAGATIGQKVYASNADGTLVSSSAATLADHTDTGFTVASTAAANELAKITKF